MKNRKVIINIIIYIILIGVIISLISRNGIARLSDLGTLDITNFACIPKNVSGSGMVSSTGWYTATSSINPSLSYNNGTLSISGLTITSYDGTRQWNTSTVTVDIYVYYCD